MKHRRKPKGTMIDVTYHERHELRRVDNPVDRWTLVALETSSRAITAGHGFFDMTPAKLARITGLEVDEQRAALRRLDAAGTIALDEDADAVYLPSALGLDLPAAGKGSVVMPYLKAALDRDYPVEAAPALIARWRADVLAATRPHYELAKERHAAEPTPRIDENGKRTGGAWWAGFVELYEAAELELAEIREEEREGVCTPLPTEVGTGDPLPSTLCPEPSALGQVLGDEYPCEIAARTAAEPMTIEGGMR